MRATLKSAVLVAAISAAASALAATSAVAQQPDTRERTKMTFSRAVEVPGATLQPGTYWFQLVDSQSSRHIVKIMNENESDVITTAQAVPIERTLDKVKGDTVLALNPTDSSAIAALDAWFYPGQIYGHEFIYPKEQARQIAERTRTFVLADEDGKTYRIGANGEHDEWVADAKSKDAWTKMHHNHKGDSQKNKDKEKDKDKRDK